jgi:hypothetical protein
MKTLVDEVNSPHPSCARSAVRPGNVLALAALLAAGLLLIPAAVPAHAQQASQSSAQAAPDTSVECVLGLEHMKHGAKGSLKVGENSLNFNTEKGKAEIPIASIQDVFTAKDSKQVFRGVGGTVVKMGVPYEGGRILSLFSTPTEVLTVEYRDANNGYHGAVFVLPKGQATVIKKQLVDKGAKASIPPEEPGKEEKKQ